MDDEVLIIGLHPILWTIGKVRSARWRREPDRGEESGDATRTDVYARVHAGGGAPGGVRRAATGAGLLGARTGGDGAVALAPRVRRLWRGGLRVPSAGQPGGPGAADCRVGTLLWPTGAGERGPKKGARLAASGNGAP
jgi:hypothetical protein